MLQKVILKLIKSKYLLNKINETKLDFSDFDLLVIAYKFAPAYDERLRLLEKIAIESSDSMTVECAKNILVYEKRKYKDFITVHENEVFEVIIKVTPDSNEERYLAKTYKGALNNINLFYDYYSDNAQETEKSRYKILKRKVFDLTTNMLDINEDIVGECTLISNNVLYDVLLYDDDTKVISLLDHIVKYPKFLNDGDLVSYIDYDLKKIYGVVTYSGTDNDSACIVDLDNKYVNSKTIYQIDENGYYPVFMCHNHIDYPLVFKENIDEVPEEVKNKYNYFMEFWKRINFDK